MNSWLIRHASSSSFPAVFEGGRNVGGRATPQSSRGLNVLETLAVDAGGTAVSLRNAIGLLKGLALRDVHEQTPETMRRFGLRLSIDPPSIPADCWAPLSSHPCLGVLHNLTYHITTLGYGPFNLKGKHAIRHLLVARPIPQSRLTRRCHPRYLSHQQRKAPAGEDGLPKTSVAEGATAPGISQAKGPPDVSRVGIWKEAVGNHGSPTG